jgi:5,10-methylenetetrahydrofolate reductase
MIAELAAAPSKAEKLETGIRMAARLIRQLKEERICDGIHIMAIGMEERVPEIMKQAGLLSD